MFPIFFFFVLLAKQRIAYVTTVVYRGIFPVQTWAYQRLRLCKSAIGVDDCILMVHSHTCKWHILVHMYVCTIMFVCTYMCNKKIANVCTYLCLCFVNLNTQECINTHTYVCSYCKQLCWLSHWGRLHNG